MRAVIGIAAAAAALGAQPDEALERRLRRLDSLASVRLTELRTLDTTDIAAHRLRPLDVDGLRLLVDSAITPETVEGFRLGWHEVRARGAGWAARVVAELELRVVIEGIEGPRQVGRTLVASSRMNPANAAAIPVLSPDAHGLRLATTALFERLLMNSIDLDLAAWLAPMSKGVYMPGDLHTRDLRTDHSLFGPGEDSAPYWSAARLHLVRTPAATSRDCLGGAILACRRSLGIDGGTAAPPTTWYAPGDFRWVSHRVSRDVDSTRRALMVACDAGRGSACERFVASAPPGSVDAPAALPTTRRSVLRLALEVGGEGAVDRLLKSTGPIPTRLATVAGLPFDSLLATWQRRVAAAPHRDAGGNGTSIVAGLVFALLLVGLPRRRM